MHKIRLESRTPIIYLVKNKAKNRTNKSIAHRIKGLRSAQPEIEAGAIKGDKQKISHIFQKRSQLFRGDPNFNIPRTSG